MVTRFPSTNIALSQICDAYGVPRNINSLRGRTYWSRPAVSSGPLTPTTVPANGPVNMGQFLGNYTGNPYVTLPLASQQGTANASNTFAGISDQVGGSIGFNNASYVMDLTNPSTPTLFFIEFSFFQTSSYGGAASSSGNNNTGTAISVDGTPLRVNNTIGYNVYSFNVIFPRNSVVISGACNASNNLGTQCSPSFSATYSIGPSGLTLTSLVWTY